MANEEHLTLLQKGVPAWNAWRKENPNMSIDLTQADLAGADLYGANLSYAGMGGANLREANLSSATMVETWLVEADLTQAKLHYTNLRGASLYKANLTEADLTNASLNEADLRDTNLTKAVLTDAHLHYARLIRTKLLGAKLNGCSVYGISAWDLELDEQTEQVNLIITPHRQAVITVPNLNVAQFLYLILNNKEIQGVIDTVTSKAVLVLGRFTPPERKAVLEAVRDALCNSGYVPVLFDFPPSANRDLTETIQLLANMARFVVADLTDAKSIPQELSHIVPLLPSVPIQPIWLASQREYAMFEHWRKFSSVLPEFLYEDQDFLINHLDERIIQPVNRWIEGERARQGHERQLQERIKQLEKQLAEQKPGSSPS